MNSTPRKSQPKIPARLRLLATAMLLLAFSLACSISIPIFSLTATPAPTRAAITTPSVNPTSAEIPTSAAPAITSAATQPPASATSAPVIPVTGVPIGLIAYTGLDGNIYTIDQNGKQHSAITTDANLSPGTGQSGRIYQYPTWSPDGKRLAYVGFSRSDVAVTLASLYNSSADGAQRLEAFSSPDSIPFYLFWSPNSQSISFLSDSGSSDLELHVSVAAGGKDQLIGTGQPYYWDWSPDNRTIIAHIGGATTDNPAASLSLFELDGKVQKKDLALKPGSFQAPAWSPTGDELVLLTVQDDPRAGSLVLVGHNGAVKQTLAQLSGPAAFAWSPVGGSLAYSTLVQNEPNGPFVRLVELDIAHPEQAKKIAQANVLAFFWSPDGRKIAYFIAGSGASGPTAQKDFIHPVAQTTPAINLTLQVYDLASGETHQLAAFSPTDSFVQVLPFYDQYQRSGTIWSPDSQNLVLAGVDPAGNDAIFIVGEGGGPLHKIAEGDLAFWSWK